MKFTHVIEANSAEEFRQAIAELHKMVFLSPLPHGVVTGFGFGAEAASPTSGAAPAVQLEKDSEGSAKVVSKKGKKAKAEKEEANEEVEEKSIISASDLKAQAAQEVEVDPFDESDAQEEKITYDQIRQTFQQLVDEGDDGMKAAKKILADFDAKKISGIKEADYAKAMDALKKALL